MTIRLKNGDSNIIIYLYRKNTTNNYTLKLTNLGSNRVYSYEVTDTTPSNTWVTFPIQETEFEYGSYMFEVLDEYKVIRRGLAFYNRYSLDVSGCYNQTNLKITQYGD